MNANQVLINNRVYTVERFSAENKNAVSISCTIEVACGKWNETYAERLVFVRPEGRLGRKILKALNAKVAA
jgi:hypothetical protein